MAEISGRDKGKRQRKIFDGHWIIFFSLSGLICIVGIIVRCDDLQRELSSWNYQQ